MKLDVMNTQTGGEGETLQATNPTPETPKDFDVSLPSQAPTDPPPTSPVVQQTIVDAPKPIVNEIALDEIQQPKREDVGYVDWFSGEVIDSVAKTQLEQANIDVANSSQEEDVTNPFSGLSIPELTNVPDSNVDENPLSGLSLSESMSTVPKLPILPIGVDSAEWAEIRNKYQGHDVKSDAFGKVTITKKEGVKSKPSPYKTKKVEATPIVETGKILEYSKNPDYEYQTTGENFLKRKKGTNDWHIVTNPGSIETLNKEFGTKTPKVKFYTYPGKDAEYIISNGQYHIRNKGDWKWTQINDPSRIKELNRHNGTDVKPIEVGNNEWVDKSVDYLTKGYGKPTAKGMNPISTDSDGNAVIGGNPTAQSLFQGTSNFGKQMISNPQSVYYEKRVGLENARDEELKYAKTAEQKNQIINRYSQMLREADETEKFDSEYVAQNNNAAAKNLSKPLPIVKQEERILDISKELGVNIHKDNIPLLIKDFGLILTDDNAEEIYDQAKSFAEKDLDVWRKSYGNHLTDNQFKEFKEYQLRLKNIPSFEDLSGLGFIAIREDIQNITDQFNTTLSVNTKKNKAAVAGKTLSEYNLDIKKELAAEIDAEMFEFEKGMFYGGELKVSMLERSKALFNAAANMHDFLIDYVKEGKIIENPNGSFKISENVSKLERSYIDNEMKKRVQNYEKIKNLGYNTLQDDISKISLEKKNLQLSIDYSKKKLDSLPLNSPERKQAELQISNASKKLKEYEDKLFNLKNSQRAIFLTEPKELNKSIAPFVKNSSSKVIFSSIDQNLSPKDRFDLFYSTLREQNKELAAKYNIDISRLDKMGANLRSMLDWESMGVSLSEAEKKYFANKKILYSLAPIFLNNENGITEESASFFESFGNIFTQTLFGGDVAAARGNMNQTQVVNEQLNKIYELGFTKEDLANGSITLKDLEERKNVSWVTAESAGEILAPTAAIMLELVASNSVLSSGMALGKSTMNLVKTIEKTGSPIKYGDKLATTLKAYENALFNTTKVGKYLKEPIEQGVQFQGAGTVFGSGEEELNFTSGLLGSFASKGLTSMLSGVPTSKLLPIVQGIFGSSTDDAIKVFQKIGQTASRGTGEVAEEFAQELTNIYQTTLDSRGFWDEVNNRFGSFDQVMKFVATSFVMGGAFNMVQSDSAADLYEEMPTEDKQKVDAVVTEARESLEDAQQVSEKVAEQAVDEVELELNIDNDFKDVKPESEIETVKASESIGENPTVNGEVVSKQTEVDNLQAEANKKYEELKNQGLPNNEIWDNPEYRAIRDRQDAAQEELDTLQQPTETTATDEIISKLDDLKIPEEVVTEEETKLRTGVPSSTGRVEPIETQKALTRGDLKTLTPSRMKEIYDSLPKELQDKHFIYGVEGVNKPNETKFFSSLKSAIGENEALNLIRTNSEKTTTEEVITDAFDDFGSIKKLRNPIKIADAKMEFENKHGKGTFERVQKINTKFDNIVKSMSENNLIEKKC